MDFKEFVVKHKFFFIGYFVIGVFFQIFATGNFHLFRFSTWANVVLWPVWMFIGFFWDLIILVILAIIMMAVACALVPAIRQYVFAKLGIQLKP